jgi:hypothetical protein
MTASERQLLAALEASLHGKFTCLSIYSSPMTARCVVENHVMTPLLRKSQM